MSLLKLLKPIISYKEPKNPEGFEFINDASEDSSVVVSEEKIENSSSSMKTIEKRKTRNIKTPLNLDELKMAKNNQTSKKSFTDKNMDTNLKSTLERIKKELNIPKNLDIVIREFKIARKTDAFLLYINGMVDNNSINDFLLRQLMNPELFDDFKEECVIDYIMKNVISISNVIKERNYEKIIKNILEGTTGVFIDKCDECLIINNQGYEKRSVEKPVTENVIRGSQAGFTEDMHTNISLIRKIVKNKNLITEIMPVDKTNNTNCAVLYIKDIANPAIIKEVKRRLQNLNIDFISGSGMLEELLSDSALMPYTQLMTTERPDRAASNIMDGKVLLITDGSPFVSSVPVSFFETLQSPEDFGLKWQFSTFLRYLRFFALFATLLLPGLYAAVTLFHPEMIPTELLNSIVKSKENVPFPTIVEITFMELSFELIREGGIRVPGVIGNTLGIVGALILGQAAAQAQLVSPILIIVIAVVGISSFAMPSYSMGFELRLIRFFLIFLGALVGFYGIAIGLVITLGLAASLKSFGTPYLVPIAPKTKSNPDVITSLASNKQKIRPDYVNPLNRHRAGAITDEWKKGKNGDKK